MINFLRSSDNTTKNIIVRTADKLNMSEIVIEKDLWVTYTLDYLFNRCKYKDSFIFKGGTSLSKAYNLIERFSEDIDIILDLSVINYTREELWENRSKTQQDKLNKKIVSDASKFLEYELIPVMKDDLEKELDKELRIVMDDSDKDRCTINFYYPNIYNDNYIKPVIRLEIGPLAESIPCHIVKVTSYAAKAYESLFERPDTIVKTIDAERTFWEKISILNKVAYGYKNGIVPARYSRHYYDVYKLGNSKYKENAFKVKDLFEQDIKFNEKFYYSKSSAYDKAKLGEIKLVPPKEIIEQLEKDYEKMKNMFFGDYPSFNTMIEYLKQLEKEINNL